MSRKKTKEVKRLIIVDISGFIFRAFYAIRHELSAPDGTPTNAVHGVLSMLQRLFSNYPDSHYYLAKDTKGPTFRHEIYDDYKANRSAPPPELIPQFSLISQMIDKMGLKSHFIENYEADDLIGSVCVQWKNEFDEILIASGDKDLMQFVGENIKMVDTMKDKLYDDQGVFEKMGVWPNQIVDYLSMLGDASDNIPGMKGIGAKGASKLLEEYGTLDKCFEAASGFKGKKLTNAFENHKEDALLSRELVQIKTDLDLGMGPSETEFQFYPTRDLIDFLKGLNFKTAVQKLENLAFNTHQSDGNDEEGTFNLVDTGPSGLEFNFETILDKKSLKDLLKKIEENNSFSLFTEYEDENFLSRNLLSLTVSFDGKTSYLLPFIHPDSKLTSEELELFLENTWGNPKCEIISSHSKRDYRHSVIKGLSFNAKIFDVTQAHFIIKSSNNHELSQLCEKYLAHQLVSLEKGGPVISELSLEKLAEFTGERSNCDFLLAEKFRNELKVNELEEVYETIDMELIKVLAKMEKEGVFLNPAYLSDLEKEYSIILNGIEKNVRNAIEEAGFGEDEINLRSPKQVGDLLFEKLKLPIISKTKTGVSTASDVLEELDSRNISPIPRMILEYRETDKLLSTYVKTLPELINPISKRVHTNFSQHTAATGRLASVNPNLQNIPVRSVNGRRIRKGFIAKPGYLFLSADYSQVELRLLAHFSGDPTMVAAFRDNQDIHKQTASEVLGIPLDKVTKDQRSGAKAVNFGLMYGQSSFGLAKQLRISRKEAKEYITKYFERFNSIKSYLDSLKEFAENHGHSKTLYGRKRFLPDILSKNRNVKASAERVAINSPIQGTAADIIKLAMINIDKLLSEKELKSKMLLQVHDELIFEVPEDELKIMQKIVQDKMENVVELEVPLSVDIQTGVNWFDLK